ncbi:MAG TPA: alpha/beta hydrolase-fold protein [Sphingomonadaceae bacterium]|nr:alpha/beta hydrolase-fold protein [Sphingomonadaceae bacterium]
MAERTPAKAPCWRGRRVVGLVLAIAVAGCAAPAFTEPPKVGDLHLSYAMPQAGGERIPYRVYLPTNWTPKRKWPLVMVLHGYAATADTALEQADGALQEQAEKHGFVLVAPNGYNGMADYGANLPLPSGLSRFGTPLKMSPGAESALAEADVVNVLDRASVDYNIDPTRIFVMGNSMGMTGTLHFAEKFPNRFCGISPSDGPPWPNYPMDRLKHLKGILFVHGEKDDIARISDTRRLYQAALAQGINAQLQIVPGGVHATAWVQSIPNVFDFFAGLSCADR